MKDVKTTPQLGMTGTKERLWFLAANTFGKVAGLIRSLAGFHAYMTGEAEIARDHKTEIENFVKQIELKDVEASALEALVNFCYSGRITITCTNAWIVLHTACYLQLNEVQDQCCAFLKKECNASNCLEIRAFAKAHACGELLCCANKYILHNFKDVIDCDEFCQFPIEQIVELISSEELRLKSAQLLVYTKLSLCHPEFLANTVDKEALVNEDAACRNLVAEAMVRRGVGVAVLNNLLYAVGGYDGKTVLRSVERYDPTTGTWSTDIAPMSHGRAGLGVASIKGFLYAVGGYDQDNQRLNIVERYDPCRNEWTSVEPMCRERCEFSVSVFDGCLYVVGGETFENSMERFDPEAQKDKWKLVRPMPTFRSYPGSAVLNGHLYAAGGNKHPKYFRTVEKYDPDTDEWTAVADMKEERSSVRPLTLHEHSNMIREF
ncbi:kelch repeat protein [Teladorsagia circumcincta]|uniref:Kelch repeat protein n=1 Tax=Teladorsagia circumcincta TaxID=45464 RepID=A0A2G9UI24_TELCI|nr:kelch repeat protein [Teladorsagia circumcincta]